MLDTRKIGKIYGVTKQNIAQIESTALKRLRKTAIFQELADKTINIDEEDFALK